MSIMRFPFIALLAAVVSSACAPQPPLPRAPDKAPFFDYPEARRSDQVDDYFGTEVADPYRWMENLESPELGAWVAAQNSLSTPWLHQLPTYPRFSQRLEALWSFERYTAPRVKGPRYFYEYNDGRSDLSRLMVLDALDAEPRTLLDPSGLSEDRTELLARWSPSPDGRLVAWAASEGGSDWVRWRIRRVDNRQDYPEILEGTKFTQVRWLPDSSGFFYSRYPRTDQGWDDGRQVAVYFHAVGTPQTADREVFRITDNPTRNPYGRVSSDGEYLVLEVYQDSRSSGLYTLPLDNLDAEPVPVADSFDGRVTYLASVNGRFILRTNIGAPRGRVVAVDPRRPGRSHWIDLVPEGPLAIEDAAVAGEHLLVHYLEDAHSRLEVFTADGRPLGRVALPGMGKLEDMNGSPANREIFLRYESFDNPGVVWRYDLLANRLEVFHQARTVLDTDRLVTRQVFYESADGTRVPMFLVHGRDLVADGTNPTLLYGYGGFNSPQLPSFDIRWAGWLDAGGVLAIANIRGGGEYGAEWHAAGTRERKQNVFDDFIAAAEWLVAEGITSPPRLAINGRSNGGLLVGAVELQRPDLFAAATPIVGVLDMLRYHTASANARAWSGDYGLSEIEADFRAQYAYSPVHNVSRGSCYPPTLIQTAAGDDRVVPWHSYKFTAALQHAQDCANPVLLRVETRTGHASSDGKPRWMRIEELAERYAFIAWALAMPLPGD
ncbi:MAG: prolyl oligopeptidase family serine peptidase [Gammaproteobacteria bacterium]